MSLSTLASPLATAIGLAPPRAFGLRPHDLDLEPAPIPGTGGAADRDRPARVTAILACCTRDDSSPLEARREAAWDLPVGDRMARLLRIVQLTEQRVSLEVTVPCPQPGCRQRLTLDLPFDGMLEHARGDRAGAGGSGSSLIELPRAGGTLALRLPTGRDQCAWQRIPRANPAEAMAAVVGSLVVRGTGPDTGDDEAWHPEVLQAMAEAMEQADPLVAFAVETVCPHCGCSLRLPLDLESVALDRLTRWRRRLMEDLHLLASHYGWTEEAILAIPARRRAEYREAIRSSERMAP